MIEVGDRIKDSEGFLGKVRYVGSLVPAIDQTAIWYGIEWDEAIRGKHDGSLEENGTVHRYFTCEANFGSFVRRKKISLVKIENLELKSKAQKVSEARMAAWKECGDMDKHTAKRTFIKELSILRPSWKVSG